MDIIIDLNNYSSDSPLFRRTAARAIVSRDGKYLLVFSSYGDYKFPGGGREENEELEDVVVREVQEETGYQVIRESITEFVTVLERRQGKHGDLLEMESHYFLCDVGPRCGDRRLDPYEEEYGYEVVWLSLPEAVSRNRLVKDFDACPWVIREVRVMEKLQLQP